MQLNKCQIYRFHAVECHLHKLFPHPLANIFNCKFITAYLYISNVRLFSFQLNEIVKQYLFNKIYARDNRPRLMCPLCP